MTSRWRTAVDPLAATAAATAALMAGLYLGVIAQQGGGPAIWFVTGLVLAAALATHGAFRTARGRRVTLAVAGLILVPFGILGILSIGLPVLVAGVLALVAAARRGPGPATPPQRVAP